MCVVVSRNLLEDLPRDCSGVGCCSGELRENHRSTRHQRVEYTHSESLILILVLKRVMDESTVNVWINDSIELLYCFFLFAFFFFRFFSFIIIIIVLSVIVLFIFYFLSCFHVDYFIIFGLL